VAASSGEGREGPRQPVVDSSRATVTPRVTPRASRDGPAGRARGRPAPESSCGRRGLRSDMRFFRVGGLALVSVAPGWDDGDMNGALNLVLNIIWLVFGGFWLALGYALAGIVCCVLIVTIPFGIASFRIAGYALWP